MKEKKVRRSTAITISLPRYAREQYEKIAEMSGMKLATYLRLSLLEGLEMKTLLEARLSKLAKTIREEQEK